MTALMVMARCSRSAVWKARLFGPASGFQNPKEILDPPAFQVIPDALDRRLEAVDVEAGQQEPLDCLLTVGRCGFAHMHHRDRGRFGSLDGGRHNQLAIVGLRPAQGACCAPGGPSCGWTCAVRSHGSISISTCPQGSALRIVANSFEAPFPRQRSCFARTSTSVRCKRRCSSNSSKKFRLPVHDADHPGLAAQLRRRPGDIVQAIEPAPRLFVPVIRVLSRRRAALGDGVVPLARCRERDSPRVLQHLQCLQAARKLRSPPGIDKPELAAHALPDQGTAGKWVRRHNTIKTCLGIGRAKGAENLVLEHHAVPYTRRGTTCPDLHVGTG